MLMSWSNAVRRTSPHALLSYPAHNSTLLSVRMRSNASSSIIARMTPFVSRIWPDPTARLKRPNRQHPRHGLRWTTFPPRRRHPMRNPLCHPTSPSLRMGHPLPQHCLKANPDRRPRELSYPRSSNGCIVRSLSWKPKYLVKMGTRPSTNPGSCSRERKRRMTTRKGIGGNVCSTITKCRWRRS
jgi:hypothetical protein